MEYETRSQDLAIRESDEIVNQVKTGTSQRKGRGFRGEHQDREIAHFDSLENRTTEPGPAKSVQGWILIVTNVHPEACEEDINNIFAEYGPLKNLHLNIDRRTGYVKGYALIEYTTLKEATKAQAEANGKDLFGVTLKVDWAFSNTPLYSSATLRSR